MSAKTGQVHLSELIRWVAIQKRNLQLDGDWQALTPEQRAQSERAPFERWTSPIGSPYTLEYEELLDRVYFAWLQYHKTGDPSKLTEVGLSPAASVAACLGTKSSYSER